MRSRSVTRGLAARTVAAVAALALLGSACGDGDEATTTVAEAGDDASTADTGSDGGDDAPANSGPTASTGSDAQGGEPSADAVAALDFTTTDLAGEAFVGREFAGRDVVLWVWAPWCSICNREAPKLRGAFADVDAAGDVVLLGLPGKDSREAHDGFVAKHDLGFLRHVVDEDGSIWSKYGVSYQPAFVFINDDGRVAVHAGPLDAADFVERIEELRAA